MQNGLICLIIKHEKTLRINQEEYEQFERFRDFSADLIKIPNFRYNSNDMITTGEFLLDNQFGLYSRYATLSRIIRRKTMDPIKDNDQRKGLWLALEHYMTPGNQKMQILMVHAARYGTEEAKENLEKMQKMYEARITPEIEKIFHEIEKPCSPEKKYMLDQIYENHMQIQSIVHSWIIPSMILELKKS
jgi:hypothetical protein